jgi:hypothetical protein
VATSNLNLTTMGLNPSHGPAASGGGPFTFSACARGEAHLVKTAGQQSVSKGA